MENKVELRMENPDKEGKFELVLEVYFEKKYLQENKKAR